MADSFVLVPLTESAMKVNVKQHSYNYYKDHILSACADKCLMVEGLGSISKKSDE